MLDMLDMLNEIPLSAVDPLQAAASRVSSGTVTLWAPSDDDNSESRINHGHWTAQDESE